MKAISVFVSALICILPAAAANFVIGGPNSTLAPSSGSYSFDGSEWTNYQAAVTNTANFGPGGIVSTPVSIQVLSSITAGTLSGLNAFVSPWWYNSDSSSYNQTVVNYFLAGGSLILLDDSTGQDGIAALLGIPTVGGADGTPMNGGAPLFSGLFGAASNVLQSGEIGYFSAANITAHGGTVCATNGSGQPTAACFNRGAYAPGSGAMVIINDIDTWTSEANYTSMNSNARFALNGTAFIINAPVVSGPPTVPALSEWGVVALAALLIGSASAALAFSGRNRVAA